ncbi:hypothetical protein ACJJTC_015800 [Scirpophaga incertulas]
MLAVQSSLENDLDIVGITVVEDKLQDKVKQTLECIRNAGIKIWMLTGDKIETAISIAFSSRLLTKHDHYTIIAKCKSKEEIDKDLTRLSLGGFNALVIDVVAKRELPELEFQKFARAYNKARKSLVDRNELMLAVQSSLENDLDIVGITVVEDKLQDKVKQTLECIRNAGIKIWMLTGDKIETAISIAFSSRLLTKHDHYTIIAKCKSKEEIDKDLTRLSLGGFNALVIDGESLAIVIEHYLDRFIDVAKNLHCLIGCRYSPTQKALMAS